MCSNNIIIGFLFCLTFPGLLQNTLATHDGSANGGTNPCIELLGYASGRSYMLYYDSTPFCIDALTAHQPGDNVFFGIGASQQGWYTDPCAYASSPIGGLECKCCISPPGYFVTDISPHSIKQCPDNTYQPNYGATSCLQCDAGKTHIETQHEIERYNYNNWHDNIGVTFEPLWYQGSKQYFNVRKSCGTCTCQLGKYLQGTS